MEKEIGQQQELYRGRRGQNAEEDRGEDREEGGRTGERVGNNRNNADKKAEKKADSAHDVGEFCSLSTNCMGMSHAVLPPPMAKPSGLSTCCGGPLCRRLGAFRGPGRSHGGTRCAIGAASPRPPWRPRLVQSDFRPPKTGRFGGTPKAMNSVRPGIAPRLLN